MTPEQIAANRMRRDVKRAIAGNCNACGAGLYSVEEARNLAHNAITMCNSCWLKWTAQASPSGLPTVESWIKHASQ